MLHVGQVHLMHVYAHFYRAKPCEISAIGRVGEKPKEIIDSAAHGIVGSFNPMGCPKRQAVCFGSPSENEPMQHQVSSVQKGCHRFSPIGQCMVSFSERQLEYNLPV